MHTSIVLSWPTAAIPQQAALSQQLSNLKKIDKVPKLLTLSICLTGITFETLFVNLKSNFFLFPR